MNKTKAPQGRFSLFSGLCLSLYPAGTQEGFPRRQHTSFEGTVAKLAMRQPFVLFKGLTFQKLCL
ncbi:hypothetical protein QMQ04_16335, partial [Escherichia coli]|nr:hypothetical protein [Escherichia coli]